MIDNVEVKAELAELERQMMNLAAFQEPTPEQIRFGWTLVASIYDAKGRVSTSDYHRDMQRAALVIREALKTGSEICSKDAQLARKIIGDYLAGPESYYKPAPLIVEMRIPSLLADISPYQAIYREKEIKAAERFFIAMGEVLPPELPL